MKYTHRTRFGELTPESAASAPATAATNTETDRPRMPLRRWLIAALIIVSTAAAGLLAVGSCGSKSSGGHNPISTVRVAHGPTATTSGVPVGYARDRAGAETAAVNTVQALTQAGQGRIPMSAVEHAVIARDPGPGLRRSLGIGTGRAPGRDVVNLVPAAVSMLEFSPAAARVSVWTVAVSRSSISDGDPASVITAWATHSVSLVWEGGDWKAKELTSQTGPTPEQSVAPGAQSPLAGALESGYYSFYVN
ncbi:hypothetical protein [Nocardia sp. NBC_01327]|uniref:hypothetical protein n=1 Tax=Nocardia sp. NBC_01327 TaxID=2903593 RepID=UPI002E148261|nr:hypothetical protein OG326_21475 [Nocardia sp. NBC_01327]